MKSFHEQSTDKRIKLDYVNEIIITINNIKWCAECELKAKWNEMNRKFHLWRKRCYNEKKKKWNGETKNSYKWTKISLQWIAIKRICLTSIRTTRAHEFQRESGTLWIAMRHLFLRRTFELIVAYLKRDDCRLQMDVDVRVSPKHGNTSLAM